MVLFVFLTVVQALVAAALVGVILMQRSEGGGLAPNAVPSLAPLPNDPLAGPPHK